MIIWKPFGRVSHDIEWIFSNKCRHEHKCHQTIYLISHLLVDPNMTSIKNPWLSWIRRRRRRSWSHVWIEQARSFSYHKEVCSWSIRGYTIPWRIKILMFFVGIRIKQPQTFTIIVVVIQHWISQSYPLHSHLISIARHRHLLLLCQKRVGAGRHQVVPNSLCLDSPCLSWCGLRGGCESPWHNLNETLY